MQIEDLTPVLDPVDALEALRREPHSSGRVGRAMLTRCHIDYASAGVLIDLGTQALDESIPNSQHDRTVAAFKLMRRGMAELELWLIHNGYNI